MRLGLMIGPDKERTRQERLAGLVADVQQADRAGFTSMWIPQVPGYLDAMTAIAVAGQAIERIELGSAVVPMQTRHPIPMDQLGLPYERPAHLVRNYLDVLDRAFAGPGQVDVENDEFRVHSPMDVTDPIAMPVMIAALAPTMLRIAGEHTSGTILWMADERAIGDYIAPRITKAASDGRRPAPRIVAGGPGALCP